MNCYYHPNTPAVSNCTDCGKALCKSCAEQFTPPVCKTCAAKRNANQKNEAIKNLIVLIIGIIAGTVIGFACGGKGVYFVAGWMVGISFGGIPIGWKALSRITPNIFLILPIIGWVVYFIIKGVLAFFVGLIIFPFRTIKGIVMLIKSMQIEKLINGPKE